MSSTLHVYVAPRRIDAGAWAEAYDATLQLLQAHPAELVAPRTLHFAGGRRRLVYSRQLETGNSERRHWHVVGDGRSGRVGESFFLHRELGHYRVAGPAPKDVLLRGAAGTPGTCDLFGGETRGRPYGVPLLAVGMLLEERFPGAVVVGGDLELSEARAARELGDELLGRKLTLPVALRPRALIRRLQGDLAGEALIAAAIRLHAGRRPALLRALDAALGRDALADWLARHLATLPSPRVFGSYWAYADWLEALGDLHALIHAACLAPTGPRWPPSELAAILATAEEARDLADPEPDSLAFAYRLVGVHPPQRPGRVSWPNEAQVRAACARSCPEFAVGVDAAIQDQRRELALRRLARKRPETSRAEDPATREWKELLAPLLAAPEAPACEDSAARTLAFALAELRRQAATAAASRRLFRESPAQLRLRLEALNVQRRFILFEESWSWLDAEADRGLLLSALLLMALEGADHELNHKRRWVLRTRQASARVHELSLDARFCARMRKLRERLAEDQT